MRPILAAPSSDPRSSSRTRRRLGNRRHPVTAILCSGDSTRTMIVVHASVWHQRSVRLMSKRLIVAPLPTTQVPQSSAEASPSKARATVRRRESQTSDRGRPGMRRKWMSASTFCLHVSLDVRRTQQSLLLRCLACNLQ